MKGLFSKSDEKTSDKAFLQGIIVSVASILLCLVALCSVTYAWFACASTSTGNNITAGLFELEEIAVVKAEDGIDAQSTDGVDAESTIEFSKDEDGVFRGTLTDVGSYIVTLIRSAESTANGYCFVKVGEGESQPTEAIAYAAAEGETNTNSLTFTIITTQENTVVEITPRWGIHSSPVIVDGGVAPVLAEENISE